jgi:murein L,D-transpeptidase YafK
MMKLDMKKHRFVIVFLFIMPLASIMAAQVPSSKRSKDAIKKANPRIQMELRAKAISYGTQVFIRMFKESKELEVWLKKGKVFEHFKTYKICTYGTGGLGPKGKQGDGKAPEGFYQVSAKSLNPLSDYHLALNLGYPNEYDRAHKRTGSALMIHGDCVSIGCYAMTDDGIEEIYSLVDAALRNGQPFIQIHIYPFYMTSINVSDYSKSEWAPFWNNLKEGYDYFELKHIPPDVGVKNQRYVFE